MFAVIHNDKTIVKDKDGNACETFFSEPGGPGLLYVRFEVDGNGKYDRLPILEHGQKYVVTVFKDVFIATFRADKFAFCNGACWDVNEVKGFAPLPKMIEV